MDFDSVRKMITPKEKNGSFYCGSQFSLVIFVLQTESKGKKCINSFINTSLFITNHDTLPPSV